MVGVAKCNQFMQKADFHIARFGLNGPFLIWLGIENGKWAPISFLSL
jgi:hypothetical protein